MWTSTAVNLVLFPFLLLISIPLAFSASITTALAFSTLAIRALLVAIELGFALLANFFSFPAESSASGSFLALTEGNTPAVERINPYGKSTKYQQQTGLLRSRRESLSSKEGVLEDYFFFQHNQPRHGHPSIPSSYEVLSNFVSGNAERDFEGVGGWRTPVLMRKKGRQASSVSSSSNNHSSGEDEELLDQDDEEAWLSINKRLELPSRHINIASPMLSPNTTMHTVDSQLRQYQNRHQSSHPQQDNRPDRPRFHRRSNTSPLISTRHILSTTTIPTTQRMHREGTRQLQTSKSSGGLDSLAVARPSSSPSPIAAAAAAGASASLPASSASSSVWHEIGSPLLMTASSSSGLGTDHNLVHYYNSSFAERRARRRSSASSSAAAAKPMFLTGLGLG